jgi:1-acyl-sn-glycerol-3-phosphate acyltransferase
MLEILKNVFSLHYDDRPMDDSVYEFHRLWVKFLHDYYLRVEHAGHVQEFGEAARHEHVILISNHAVTVEAALIAYFLHLRNAGKLSVLVYKEAFKLPLIREFFRSCQCVPISIDAGVEALRRRHILIFPEGMDFISGYVNSKRIPRFHKGFLRIAKKYLEATGKKSVRIVPVGHAGVENTLKFWVIRNESFLDAFVRPFASYPFFLIPKLPFLFPSKVVMNWGMPTTVTLEDLKNERRIAQKANHFRANLIALKTRAQKLKGMNGH